MFYVLSWTIVHIALSFVKFLNQVIYEFKFELNNLFKLDHIRRIILHQIFIIKLFICNSSMIFDLKHFQDQTI